MMGEWKKYKHERAATHFMRKSILADYWQPLCKPSDDSHWYAPVVLEPSQERKCKKCERLLKAAQECEQA
jgi:hypothetical protein